MSWSGSGAGRSAALAYQWEQRWRRRRRAASAVLTLLGAVVLLGVWALRDHPAAWVVRDLPAAWAIGGRSGQPGGARHRDLEGWQLVALGAVAALWLAAWRVRPAPDPQRWLRGAAGEMATADVLSRLPPRRYQVLHDRRIPGSRANLDHVVIGPTGVWVIDSKAYRAALRVRWRSVWAGERRLDVAAVAWEASVVAERLSVEARPLVVVHGRGLPRRGRVCDGVRVVPASALIRRLRSSGRARWLLGCGHRLTEEEVRELGARCHRVFAPATGSSYRSPA